MPCAYSAHRSRHPLGSCVDPAPLALRPGEPAAPREWRGFGNPDRPVLGSRELGKPVLGLHEFMDARFGISSKPVLGSQEIRAACSGLRRVRAKPVLGFQKYRHPVSGFGGYGPGPLWALDPPGDLL